MMSDDSEEHLRDHADETEAALAAAQKILHTAGIVEIAARNPQVMEYMQHWETRAEKAEGERDAAIAALSEEGRRRGEVEAERDALREALAGLSAAVGPFVADCFYDNGDVTLARSLTTDRDLATLFWQFRQTRAAIKEIDT